MKNYISSERVNLFEPNVYIQFLVKILGAPSVDDLMSAVRIALLHNEATMSRIVLEKDGKAFYEKMNESGCPIFVTSKEWTDIINENEKIPFKLYQGELLRIFIITAEEETSLLIMAHHLVGDGKSIVYFIEDVLKVLSGETLKYKALHLIKEDNFPKKSKLPLHFKMYAKIFNQKWSKHGHIFGWDDYYNLHNAYWKNHSTQIIYHTFSAEELDKIKYWAKEMGVTINSFITTAFQKADMDSNQIGVAVQARMDSNRSISNQTTGISIKHHYLKRKSFEKNARLIHQKIYKNLNNPFMKFFVLRFIPLFNPSLIDSVLLNSHGLYNNKLAKKLAKVMGYRGKAKRDLGITNLTEIDINNDYGFFKIANILFIAPAVSYTKRIISISTLNSEMTILYRFMDTENIIANQEFFARAIENIMDYCEHCML